MTSIFRRKSQAWSIPEVPPAPPEPAPALPQMRTPQPVFTSPLPGLTPSPSQAEIRRSPSVGKSPRQPSTVAPIAGFHRPSATLVRQSSPPGPIAPQTTARTGGGITKSPSAPSHVTGSSNLFTHPTTSEQAAGRPQTGFSYKSAVPISPSLDDLARAAGGRPSIASMYPSRAADMPLLTKSRSDSVGSTATTMTAMPKSASLPNVRRAHKVLPTLNLLVVGPKRTGKTGFVRTFLGNTKMAGGTEMAARARQRVAEFGIGVGGGVGRTRVAESVTVDVAEEGERTTVTVFDTPGLSTYPGRSSRPGDEVEVDRQLGEIVRMVEAKFEETLAVENQVVRHSKRAHDGHLHLCLYFVDPLSFTHRPRAKPRAPVQIAPKPRANGAIALHATPPPPRQPAPTSPPPTQPSFADGPTVLGLSEVDLRAIRCLSKRVNVLPVIGRADELTVARLAECKAAVKRDLRRLGISWGAFAPNEEMGGDDSGREETGEARRSRVDSLPTRLVKSSMTTNGSRTATARESVTPVPVPVPGGLPVGLEDDEDTPKASAVPEPPAEPVKLIRVSSRSRGMSRSLSSKTVVTEVGSEEEEEEEDGVDYAGIVPFAVVAPDDGPGAVKGRFVREFRHGTLDVLNPDHSDLASLREALLLPTILKSLKDSTRLDKYEPYRTEWLLARQASPEAVTGIIRELDGL